MKAKTLLALAVFAIFGLGVAFSPLALAQKKSALQVSRSPASPPQSNKKTKSSGKKSSKQSKGKTKSSTKR